MKRSVFFVALAGAVSAFGANVTVSNSVYQLLSTPKASGGDTLTATSADYGTYPSGLATPAFWFDASDRSGWTVDEGNAVTRVPSKSNATRYLTSDVTGASWTGWGGVNNTAPVLAYDEDLGANCLDFGVTGSCRAMIFDAEQPEGCTATNKLSTIGTAFMVIGSQNGGGWVFGGGATSMINWHRGTQYSGYTQSTPYHPLAYDAANCAAGFYYSYTRHDGETYIPWLVGFNGGWEVFTFTATNAAMAATLAATGVGVNDGRAFDGPGRSGGMKLAEMIVFNEVLTLDQVKSVEKWLRKKWFGYAAAGESGHARLSELVIANTDITGIGKTTTINAPSGQTLKVDLLRGGRNKGGLDADDDTLTVSGAGAVALRDATRYNGDIVLAGGTLKFETPRPVPAAAQLPREMLMRFDVSDGDSVTTVSEYGTNFITKIANLTEKLYNGFAYSLRPTKTTFGGDDRRPWLQTGWTPTGLPLADFGPARSWSKVIEGDGSITNYLGCNLKFYMGEAGGGVKLTTAIAVIDARRGGGWLMNQGFQRAKQCNGSRSNGLLQPGNLTDSTASLSTYPYLTPGTNGAAYINGERVANPGTTGYNEGLQVVALQIPGSTPDLVGAYWDKVSGELVFGELLLWNRALTETEIRDASAYLAKKWMGETLAGYTRDDAVPDVQNLANTAVSTIEVDEGATARVGALTLGADIVKAGAGALEIGSISNASNCRIVMEGGSVRFSSPLEPATASSPAIAPALHFDPTETNDWTLTESGGAQRITQVRDRANGLRLYHDTAAYAPIFSTDAGLTCNGLPVADFGAAAGEYSAASSTRYALHFNRPIESTRAVYAVWRLKAGSCAFFMGSSDAAHCGVVTDYRYDWHRGSLDGGSANAPLFGGNTAAAIKNGEILTNGVAFAYTEKPVDDEWRLMEVHTTKGVHISAFGTDRGGMRTGGMVLGEVLVYERPLNAREKVATRNYLLKKWFGKTDGELAPLPEIAEADAPRVGSLLVDETTELELNGGFAVTRLYGEGTLVKSGEGTLEVIDALAYSGTVHVAEGAFRLLGHAPDDTPELATRGLAFHLDAEKGVTVTTNGSGRVEVPVWDSALNDGWKAVSATGTYGSVTINSTAQYVPEPELDGRPSVRMAASGTGKYECYRFIDPSGGWQAITNIRSALWVIGSQEGGGFLFGGGDHSGASGTGGNVKYYAWHRGSYTTESAGRHKEDSLTSISGFSEIYNYSSWRVNGTAHGAQDANPLSGGWDVVSCRFTSGHAAPADGLAYDGRIFAGENYRARCGNQRLAELLVYTNRLSDTELLQTEAYLNGKWRLNGCLDGFENAMEVVVDDGAAFDLGGYRQYVASLGGEGIVSNGTIVAGAVVADADAAALTVEGTFEFASGMQVELKNLASLGNLRGKTIQVLSATSYAGLENLNTVVFSGETFSEGLAAKLHVVDGVLSVTFVGKGSVIFFK